MHSQIREASINSSKRDDILAQAHLLEEKKQYEEALECYNKMALINPKDFNALVLRINVLTNLQRWNEVVLSCDQLLIMYPESADVVLFRANILFSQGCYQEAIAGYEHALTFFPSDEKIQVSLGNALVNGQRLKEAVERYDAVLGQNKNIQEAWFGRGVALRDLRDLEGAVFSFEQALFIAPHDVLSLQERANTLNFLHRLDEAVVAYDAVLAIAPDHIKALLGQADVLLSLRQDQAALMNYEKVLQLDPNNECTLGNVLHLKLKLYDWNQFDSLYVRLIHEMQANKLVATPVVTLSLVADAALQKKHIMACCAQFNPVNAELGEPSWPYAHSKIRVAYFSADFNHHPTMYLMAELFESHDRTQFEWVAFSFGPKKEDTMRTRAEKAFDHFIDVSNISDREIAKLAREMEIDIAVDLMGYTRNARPNIFALRSAPIQVNYLGYPGTMGASYMDYILADPVLVPPEYAMYYTEKIAYLPKVFQANDQKREVSDIIWSRQEMGLPEGAFVFCCFNQSYKILPEVFSVWMRLLDRVPNSVLWLIANTALAQENLKKEALVRGIDPARLVFAQKLPVAQYLACYRLVDLFLDTWPYNAGATASDALWMGVPVISYMGQTFSSRMAGALLHALELPELMVNDIKAYETKAYTLATQPKVLVQIKQKLTDQVKVSNVFKGAIIAKQIEAIYLKMIKRHYDKLPPDMLSPNEDSI